MKSVVIDVATEVGLGRLTLSFPAQPARAQVLLSHGAGTNTNTVDLQALSQQLPAHGYLVGLFDQPWVLAGRKVATAPPTLDVGLRAALAELRQQTEVKTLILGGRSAGARSACRVSTELGDQVAGCLALSFPLHPPGKPEKSRLAELTAVLVPTLVVQGSKDPFGRPSEFPPDTNLSEIADAPHSFKSAEGIVEAVKAWLERLTT